MAPLRIKAGGAACGSMAVCLSTVSAFLASGELVLEIASKGVCHLCPEWQAHVTAPKGGRGRRVPMTKRLAAALEAHRHLRGPRILYTDELWAP